MRTQGQANVYKRTGIIRAKAKEIIALSEEYEKMYRDDTFTAEAIDRMRAVLQDRADMLRIWCEGGSEKDV